MQVQVLPFGQLTDVMGAGKRTFAAIDTDELRRLLEEKFPGIKDRHFAIAVNREIIHTNTVFTDEAEVALLPPSSGG